MKYLGLLVILAPFIAVARISNNDLAAARDVCFRAVLLAVMLALVTVEPVFVPIVGWLGWQWKGGERWRIDNGWESIGRQLGLLVLWGAIAATWFLIRSIPPDGWWWVTMGWQVAGGAQVGRMVSQWAHGERISGSLGQRTVAGSYLALLLALAPWPCWPLLAVGLWLSGPSWGALLALSVGLGLRSPWVWVGSLVLGAALAGGWLLAGHPRWKVGSRDQWPWLARLLERTPRGASVDTLQTRWGGLRFAWARRSWAGYGDGNTNSVMFRYRWAHKATVPESDLHCDPLQFALEYGWAGWATIALVIWRVGSGLHWGDPWSAAAVTGAVLALTGIPLRVAPVALVILTIWAKVAP